jgi:hypothetical protein
MLQCPECESSLTVVDGTWRCEKSGHIYDEKEGIIQFTKNIPREERYFPEHAFDILYQSEERNFWFGV